MTASMDEERASLPSSPATEHEDGGDSACWAHRVCPECGPLDGIVWPEDAGPMPPLHVNCRCSRQYALT